MQIMLAGPILRFCSLILGRGDRLMTKTEMDGPPTILCSRDFVLFAYNHQNSQDRLSLKAIR